MILPKLQKICSKNDKFLVDYFRCIEQKHTMMYFLDLDNKRCSNNPVISIRVSKPAARGLVNISKLKVQDDEVGDGTTSVTVLAAELLRVRLNNNEYWEILISPGLT